MVFKYCKALILFSLSLLLIKSAEAQSEKVDRKLQHKLEDLFKGFHGDAGVYVKNLRTGRIAAINADTLFPTASMIKVTIQCTLFDKLEKGTLSYHQLMEYRDSLLYPGEDILGSFKDKDTIDLSKVVMLMITMSDNTAALWCQSLAGGGVDINNWLSAQGFKYTRMNSRTPGRHNNWEQYGWGQTTPREMAKLLIMIRKGEAVSKAASERMYRNLTHIYWDGDALSQIPPYVQAASKQGAVDDSRSEVVLVNAPQGNYVFCVDTKNIEDQSWDQNNEAWVLIRKLSALLWHYYEPKSHWQPAEGMQKYLN